MAVVNTFNKMPDDEEEKKPQDGNEGSASQDQFTNKPVSISGTSAPDSDTAVKAGSSAAPTIGAGQGSSNQSNPTSSGRFTNLNNYLTANKGYNEQGGGLAGQVTSNFKNQSNAIKGNFNNAQTNFTQQAQQGTPQYDASLVNNALANPNQFVQNTDNVNAFAKQRDASYTGPTTFDADHNLHDKAVNLQDTANLTSSEGGRYSLLNKMFGKSGYSNGAQGLDNLLLQGNGQQLGALQNSRSLPTDLINTMNNTIAQDENTAQQNMRSASAVSQQTRDALNPNIINYDTRAKALADQYNLAQQQALYHAQQGLYNNKMSDADIQRFKVSPTQALYPGMKLGDYLNVGDKPATANNVMSAQDYANIAALSKLSGGASNLNDQANNVLASYANPAQAGTYDGNPYSFNTDKLTSDAAAGKDAYTNILNSIDPSHGKNGPQNPIDLLNNAQNQLSQYNSELYHPTGSTEDDPQVSQQLQSTIDALQSLIGKYGIDANGNLPTVSTGNYSIGPKRGPTADVRAPVANEF